jgi:hypothetical protein
MNFLHVSQATKEKNFLHHLGITRKLARALHWKDGKLIFE